VAGYARREETCQQALERGVCDEVFESPGRAVRDADLSVACVPIRTIPALIETCRESFKPQSIITDVGSTKGVLMREMEGMLCGHGVVFVGSHPMAGSEQEGLESARADLYEGAVVAVTPCAGSPDDAVAAVKKLWSDLGAEVCVMTADEHDQLVARTSHLPHVVAGMLAGVAGREPLDPRTARMIGKGFEDSTRIAEGSPMVWRDILETNAECIAAELGILGQRMAEFVAVLKGGDFDAAERLLEGCRGARRELLKAKEQAGR
jgi:prephenate dehydrogenase